MEMVYLKYVPKGRVLVKTGDGTEYVTTVQNNLALVAVQSQHVTELLNKLCGCCGQQRKCFVRATDEEVVRWYNTGA